MPLSIEFHPAGGIAGRLTCEHVIFDGCCVKAKLFGCTDAEAEAARALLEGRPQPVIGGELAATLPASEVSDKSLAKAIAHADELIDFYDKTAMLPNKYADGLRRLRNAMRVQQHAG